MILVTIVYQGIFNVCRWLGEIFHNCPAGKFHLRTFKTQNVLTIEKRNLYVYEYFDYVPNNRTEKA